MSVRVCGNNRGFSLIELSVVIAIVGLIVGGVLVGATMIKNAELQQFMNRVATLRNAIKLFETRYQKLPGDYNEASRMWPTATLSNGNGDGLVNMSTAPYYENYSLWQHLSLSKLINEQYGPVPGSTPAVPTGMYKTYFTIHYAWNNHAEASRYLRLSKWSTVYLGADIIFAPISDLLTGGTPNGFGIRPTEAYHVDSKMDDGLPYTGSIWTLDLSGWGVSHACTENDASSTGRYKKDASAGVMYSNCQINFLY